MTDESGGRAIRSTGSVPASSGRRVGSIPSCSRRSGRGPGWSVTPCSDTSRGDRWLAGHRVQGRRTDEPGVGCEPRRAARCHRRPGRWHARPGPSRAAGGRGARAGLGADRRGGAGVSGVSVEDHARDPGVGIGDVVLVELVDVGDGDAVDRAEAAPARVRPPDRCRATDDDAVDRRLEVDGDDDVAGDAIVAEVEVVRAGSRARRAGGCRAGAGARWR